LLAIGTGFITGMFTGFANKASEQGIAFSEVGTGQLFVLIGVGLFILLLLVGGVFLFLRWGFRKLYGNYIEKLNQTLKELEEIES
jgi:hypothetical protein